MVNFVLRKIYQLGRYVLRRTQPPTLTYTRVLDKSNYVRLGNMLKQVNSEPRILEVGCGTQLNKRNHNLGDDLVARIIKFDIVQSPITDCVADAHCMPFTNNMFHAVLFHSEIEHMHTPQQVINEIHRVLAVGGIVYTTAPFIFFCHGGDYYRFSKLGLQWLFREFDEIEISMGEGPSSALAWILRYYLSILFCFNNRYLFIVLMYIFGWLFLPLKYLDVMMQKFPRSEIITSGFYCFHRKPKK